MMRSILIIMVTSIGLSLAGCASVVEMASEDRTMDHIETDTAMIAGIKNDINNQMGSGNAFAITNDVYEQTVMLTGTVYTVDERAHAGNIANAHPNVKKVINELQVVPEGTEAKEGDSDFVNDFVVKNKFYAKLASTAGVSHTNWRFNSVNGVLYLFGRSLSQSEMSKVISIAKNTEGVRKVVNHAFVRAL